MTAALQRPRGDPFVDARHRMVEEQIRARGSTSEVVLAALRTVPRHEFVPEGLLAEAYEDRALPLGPDQSISQPYIVALMTEAAGVRPCSAVLEVGTGSGYQAAVLAELNADVYTIDLDAERTRRAAETLRRLGYRRVEVRCCDGRAGWPEAAPFDSILVTAGVSDVPPALIEQLAPLGNLVVPVTAGREEGQTLRVLTKDARGQMTTRDVLAVRFVPMV